METYQYYNESNQEPQPEFSATARPQLSFTEAVRAGKSKFFEFTGRSRRSEFWGYSVFGMCLTLVPLLLALFLGVMSDSVSDGVQIAFKVFIGLFLVVGCVASVVMGISLLAAQTRRLHDTGRSGWWLVAGLVLNALISGPVSKAVFHFAQGMTGDTSAVPVDYWERMGVLKHISPVLYAVGMTIFAVYIVLNITLIAFYCQDSHKAPNKYGPSPKYQ